MILERAHRAHISVCVCTYKRTRLLKCLLDALLHQDTDGLFDYSIIVADNDAGQSAQQVVVSYQRHASIPVVYCVEPEQNIALARNRAIEQANGDFIALIDDDEIPERNWLWSLYNACIRFRCAGVLGPVKPLFEKKPPSWIIAGHFFERPRHTTGYKIGSADARTGNVLFKREILVGVDPVFRPQFSSGGEDVDFFERMHEGSSFFVWCDEAVVHERIPPARCRLSYLLRSALLRGNIRKKLKKNQARLLLTSLVAIPMYLFLLPYWALVSRVGFIKVLVKVCDHVGRVLAFLGLNPIHRRRIT